jgi:hypothetical protein
MINLCFGFANSSLHRVRTNEQSADKDQERCGFHRDLTATYREAMRRVISHRTLTHYALIDNGNCEFSSVCYPD